MIFDIRSQMKIHKHEIHYLFAKSIPFTFNFLRFYHRNFVKNCDFLCKLYMFITIFKNSRCFIRRDLSASIFCLIVSRFLTVHINDPEIFQTCSFPWWTANHYWMRSLCRGLAFILLVRVQTYVRQIINWNVMFSWFWIAHFKVAGENEAGVDLVLWVFLQVPESFVFLVTWD